MAIEQASPGSKKPVVKHFSALVLIARCSQYITCYCPQKLINLSVCHSKGLFRVFSGSFGHRVSVTHDGVNEKGATQT